MRENVRIDTGIDIGVILSLFGKRPANNDTQILVSKYFSKRNQSSLDKLPVLALCQGKKSLKHLLAPGNKEAPKVYYKHIRGQRI